MSTRPTDFGEKEEIPQAFGTATFEQGPTTPEEEARLGELTVGQVESGRSAGFMTFDDWVNNVPDIIRARAYDTIAIGLMIAPTEVEDHYIEILGEAFFNDREVWQSSELWVDPPTGNFRQPKTWDERIRVWMSTPSDPEGPVGATIDTFMDAVAAGDPERGVEGDPTLQGFMRGGSGMQTFKYPLAYQDRKDFIPFLGTLPAFSAGSPVVVAGIKGAQALAGGAQITTGNRLLQASVGQTRSAWLLRQTAGILRWPIMKTAGAVRTAASKPAVQNTMLLLGAAATDFGFFLAAEGVAEPEAVQEIQTAAIASFQEALTQGDYVEAQVIYEGALYQGMDMSGASVDVETGEGFTFLTAAGEEVAIAGPEGEIGPRPAGEPTPVYGDEAGEPISSGKLITIPGAFAASFGAGGTVTVVPYSYTKGYDELGPTAQQHVKKPEPLLGTGGQFPAITSDYIATRWYPDQTTLEQQDLEMGQIHQLMEGQQIPGSNRMGRGQFELQQGFFTEQVLPIFRGDDYTEFLNSLDPIGLIGVQAEMIQAGYMDPEGTINGVLFQPGLIDQKTRRAMAIVMVDANANGYQNIHEFLDVVKATGKPHETRGPGGGFRRAPFERRAYLAPDYDTLTQYIKGVVERKIGRKFNDSEMVLAGDQMKQDHRANFDIEEKARRAQYDAAGRGGDPGFAGEMIDPEASFAEFFDTTYATEIERRDTVEDVYQSTQNLFGSLDNAARLIGRS